MRRLLPLAAFFTLAPPASGQGFTPAEAARRMTLPPGFTARVVAHEPTIRQPVSMSFDSRGRLWVLQYLQYPNYAGLKPVKQDQYLRTIWDRVPEPPPRGPKGADRLTILSDPDENGVFRKSHDFVGGLNIASGFCLGHGGVYVAQPPYLLYYPDKNDDDQPDADPEVLLTGFGMDDTHSLANSLQWGPDGWLYGAAGSTSNSAVKNPADPQAKPVEFQQGVWRYHPTRKVFELFSEGGGNTYGLDFDKHGQLIAGTNWGGFACLHQFPGAYYVKGFSKHGPLHNPHTYGYFDHVPYTGFKGGHVTNGGIVYQADAFPPEYRDQYIAANLLSNAVYWHKLEPDRASFKARHGGDLLEAHDTWFRPIDLIQGPDGSVYVADFTDRRAAHLDPVDNWDRTNGRIYKIEYQGTPKLAPFDLRTKTPAELVELLKHPNVWYRREARRLLTEKPDRSLWQMLRKRVVDGRGVDALESLWALHGMGGAGPATLSGLLRHPDEHVRAWAIRLWTRPGGVADWPDGDLLRLVAEEISPVVLAELACSARHQGPTLAVSVGLAVAASGPAAADPHLPLLAWWAVESGLSRGANLRTAFHYNRTFGSLRDTVVSDGMIERMARRLTAAGSAGGYERIPDLLADGREGRVRSVVTGMARAAEGRKLDGVPPGLKQLLGKLWLEPPTDTTMGELLARMGDPEGLVAVRRWAENPSRPDAERVKWLALLRQVGHPDAKQLYLDAFAAAKADAHRLGLLDGMAAIDDPAVGDWVLVGYKVYSPAVKKRAVQLLLSRPAWASRLLDAVEAGTVPAADLTLDHARTAVGLGDPKLTARMEKKFGKLTAATAGEKQARIASLQTALGRTPGDPAKGKGLFTKHCAACHKLHGDGGAVGPDLTTADRKNRGYLLAQTVDPSGYIRPEFVVQSVATLDGRKLAGIVTEAGGSLTLLNMVDNQPQKTVIPKAEVESAVPSAVSLMPERLLDALTDAEVADLFAYLAFDPPAKIDNPKLTVCLVSGSFEYQSDASLDILQKELERHGVRCTRATAKTETEIVGLDHLAAADAAVFFTRRLRVPPAELKKVKAFVESKKPIVGVRTASHGFQDWLDMDGQVFGGNYKGHYGVMPTYDLTVADGGKGHPILKGVSLPKGAGSLYKNPGLAADVTVLLRGSIPAHAEPVAWARDTGGRRAVYTSLGHQDDFKRPDFLRLLVNGLAWASKTELAK